MSTDLQRRDARSGILLRPLQLAKEAAPEGQTTLDQAVSSGKLDYDAKHGLPGALVTVRFLTSAEGGRPSPVNSGYRVQIVFHDDAGAAIEHDCMFDFRRSEAAIERNGEAWLPLGVEDTARMVPFDAGRMVAVIVPGAEFEVREGRTLVGTGRVVEAVARA